MTSLPSKVYNSIITSVDKFVPSKLRPLWMHPAGPKHVFFYAPLAKWVLVLAGIGDLNRPADKISINQAGVVATTGFIGSRWAVVIVPKNWSLFLVNMFVGITQLIMFMRAYNYRQQKQSDS